MMAEEDTGTGEEENNEPAQMTVTEEKASKSGWRPKEDWKGDEDEWVDAKEFNYRGDLMGRISEQSSILNNFKNQIAERDKTIQDLVDHHKNMSDREYKKALKALQSSKVEAIDDGDGASVVEIDNEIDELKDKRDAANKTDGKPRDQNINDTTPKEVIDWLQKPQNKWYTTDSFMKNVADAIAKELYQKSPNLPPATLLQQMDERMRKELPHKFEDNPSVNNLGTDDATHSSRKPRTKKLSMRDLNDDQQAVARRFIKSGLMTLDEYIDDLKTVGDI